MALTRPQHPARVAIIAIIVLIAVNAAIIGTRATTSGPATTTRPQGIVDLSPQESELQLPQAPIDVVLDPQYTAQLTLDGHPIPQDQFIGSQNPGDFTFTPGPGKDFTELRRGTHNAVIEYWPRTIPDVDTARQQGKVQTYSWSFEVG